jgi:hypothetical protein
VAKFAEIVPPGGDCRPTLHDEAIGGCDDVFVTVGFGLAEGVGFGVVDGVGVTLVWLGDGVSPAEGFGLLLQPTRASKRRITPTVGRRLTLPL